MSVAGKLATAMVPTTDQSSVRRRWGIIKLITTNGTVSVEIAGVTIPGVKRLASYQPTVGERVQVDVVGTDMVVSGATAPSPRAYRRPVGDIEPTLRRTPKPDTLFLDGATKNRADYPELWAWAVAENLHNGVFFGNGNGTSTFVLPDFRGLTTMGAGTRGADTYALGLISGAVSRSLVTENIPAHKHNVAVAAHTAHTHTVSVSSAGSHNHSGGTSGVGDHGHGLNVRHNASDLHQHNAAPGTVAEGANNSLSGASGGTFGGGAHSHSFTTNNNGDHSHSGSAASGGPTTHTVTETTVGPTTVTPVDIRQPSVAINWAIWC